MTKIEKIIYDICGCRKIDAIDSATAIEQYILDDLLPGEKEHEQWCTFSMIQEFQNAICDCGAVKHNQCLDTIKQRLKGGKDG